MERRKEGRQAVSVPVWIEGPASLIPSTLSNLSLRGGEVHVSVDLALPKQFTLRLTQDGKIRRGCSLVWREGSRVGVEFFKLKEKPRRPALV
jgi:hypothetical protein